MVRTLRPWTLRVLLQRRRAPLSAVLPGSMTRSTGPNARWLASTSIPEGGGGSNGTSSSNAEEGTRSAASTPSNRFVGRMHPPKVTEDSMSCRVKRRMLGSNGSPVRWYVAAVYLEDISADVDLAPDAGMIRHI